MRKHLLIIFCILSIMKIQAQHYSDDRKTFTFKYSEYVIEPLETDNEYGYEAQIKIYNIKYGQHDLIKTKKIQDTKYDADLITFGDYVYEGKKYVLIQNRYSFYILNMYNNEILGPYSPQFYGIGEDAQSGMITGMKIIYKGRFVCGYSVDSGCFLFDISDTYRVKEITPATNPMHSENRVYVLKQFGQQGKKFGLFLKSNGLTCKDTFLFKNKFIRPVTHQDITGAEENTEIEYPYAEYNYTILNETINKYISQYSVYDNYTGKKIILPKSVARSTERKVKAYLNKH